mmetsp:Transcript_46640/g.117486  ORF Transcript_46640/g.117486 Transcript_46640/m.117486 type:complete len:326 (+) Transcript_46640:24-1001(+)
MKINREFLESILFFSHIPSPVSSARGNIRFDLSPRLSPRGEPDLRCSREAPNLRAEDSGSERTHRKREKDDDHDWEAQSELTDGNKVSPRQRRLTEKHTYFEYLYSPDGYSRVQRWFLSHSSSDSSHAHSYSLRLPSELKESISSKGSGIQNAGNTGLPQTQAHWVDMILTENLFLKFLRQLTDLADHEILEIFDIFDKEDHGSIGFNEFFLLISMYCAKESGQSTQFLYMHSVNTFSLLCEKNSNVITFERFTRLGYILGLPETQLMSSLKEYSVNVYKPITYEEFTLYYFLILDDMDKGRKPVLAPAYSPQNVDLKQKQCVVQ